MSTVSSESPKVQYSVQRELSDGSLNRISVRVPYFSKDDIHVYVSDIEIKDTTVEGSKYTWRWDGDYIAITPNVDQGIEVLVRRITPIDEAIHIFDGRSEFDDQSMDENFQQLIYIAQEYSEGSGIKDVFSDINMHGYKIKNVGWATDDDDVVTYGQYKQDAEGAKVAMQRAETAATKAEAHEKNTKAIADKAQTDITVSKDRAITEITNRIAPEIDKARVHAITAQASAGTAVSASNRAEVILQDVMILEDQAEGHAGTSEAAKNLAKDWATKTGTTVDGSEYSAKHYANEAKKNADKTDSDLTAITNAKTQAIKDINASKDTAVQAVTDKSDEQTVLIESEGDTQIQRVRDEGTAQVGIVDTKGTQEVQKVTAEGTKQVGIVSAQGTTSANAVKVQQTTSTNAVVAEGDKQIKRVTDHGTTTIGLVTAEGTKQVTRVTDTGSAQITNVQTEGTKQVDLAKAEVTKATAQTAEATRQAERARQYADQMATGQIQADWAETSTISKAFILNKPTLGALASKDSIAYSEITGTPPEQDLSGLATKEELQTGLAGKAPKSHVHTEGDISGLTAKLNAKANATDLSNLEAEVTRDLQAVNNALAGKAPTNHTHTSAQVTDLSATLAPYAKTTDVNTGLAGKANKAHTHTVSQITDMPKVVLSVNGITPDDSGNVKVGALPLGHLFAWPYQTPPDGAIQCNGATYNRSLYKDFFAYATSKGWVKTEAEWQEIATRDNGFCPFYSSGDGSTNFRTPKFAPFMQVAIDSANVGMYHRAGLPNITGTFTEHGNTSGMACTGVFTGEARIGIKSNSGAASDGGRVTMDASRSSPLYGRSNTVQPESHEWMICVVVAGQATNLGSVDVSNAQVQAQMNELSGVTGDVTKLKNFFNGTFTKTLLAGGPLQSDWIGSGTITLAEPWDNFDALLIFSGNDASNSYITSTLIYKWQLSELFAIAKTSGKRYMQIWNGIAGGYWGVRVSSSTSIAFNDTEDNSGLQAIYGLKC